MGVKVGKFVLAFLGMMILKNLEFVKGSEQAVKQTLTTMFSNYESAIRPYYGEKPVHVGITAYILSIPEMSEKDMDFTLTMYLRQTWDDPRLGFRNSQRGLSYSPLARNITYIGLDETRSKSIWKPDTFFVNEKKSMKHDITTTNEFYRISPNGTVLRSTRYTMKLTCPMDLQYYPFDSQFCTAEIESFATNMETIIYYWNGGDRAVGISSEVNLPEFRVVGYRVETIEISLKTGNYSRLILHIQLQRSFGYHLLRYYFPMLLLVLASGLSLLLATPSGGSLIQIVTILSFLLHSEITWMREMPKISYLTSMEVYAFGCLIHLILALLVSLGDGFQYSRYMSRMNSYCICNSYKPLLPSELDKYRRGLGSKQNDESSFNVCGCNGGMIIFCCMKWIVIILSITFNVLYWMYYGSATKIINPGFIHLQNH